MKRSVGAIRVAREREARGRLLQSARPQRPPLISDAYTRRALVSSVYFLRHPWEPWIKVGVAQNVRKRMKAYALAWGAEPLPPAVIEPSVIAAFGVDAYRIENAIHFHLKSDQVRTEWFKLSPAALALEAACADPTEIARLLGIHAPALRMA